MNSLISLRAKFAQSHSFNGGGLRAIVDIGKSMQMQGVDLGWAAALMQMHTSQTHVMFLLEEK